MIEKDFCSARQAYAHVQQEKVTKKKTSAPIPKNILSMKSLREELLEKSTLIETTHPGQAP